MTRYLRTLLFAIQPTDPIVFGSVAAVLAAAAITGCYFSAQRHASGSRRGARGGVAARLLSRV
jgi:hypothetical protein